MIHKNTYLTYNKIGVIIHLTCKYKRGQTLARDMLVAYLFFLLIKKGRWSAFPARIILCFCLRFHCRYLLTIAIQLVAILSQTRSFLCTSFLQSFNLVKGCCYYIISCISSQAFFTNYQIFQSFSQNSKKEQTTTDYSVIICSYLALVIQSLITYSRILISLITCLWYLILVNLPTVVFLQKHNASFNLWNF